MRAIAACLCLLSLVMGSRCEKARKRGGASESPATLSAELGLTFTPGTRVLGVHRDSGGMDDAVLLKLEIPKTEFETFWATTHIDRESMWPARPAMLGPDEDFWDPNKASALSIGKAARAGGRAMTIGLDESRPDVAVVFILEHGT